MIRLPIWPILALVVLALPSGARAVDTIPDARQDILVTFVDAGPGAARGGVGAPYRNRKRYSISATAKRDAAAVADEYTLTEVDSWPIKSLAVYCVVYRVGDATNRQAVIERLTDDPRVESVQLLNEFGTRSGAAAHYDDPHAGLQYGLETMSVTAAHARSRGRGVRIAIIASEADADHEDLDGRLKRIENFAGSAKARDAYHGTAVASVIGARSNNAKGIVGIAPEARLEMFTACWGEAGSDRAVCDSFTLAKALDAVVDNPPDIVNLSLTGPHDPLLERLLRRLHRSGVILVAAETENPQDRNRFPADVDVVIGVASSRSGPARASTAAADDDGVFGLFAPGDQILVAIPGDGYDFRSGSSIAAAHVTGVIALLLSRAPELSLDAIRDTLARSQAANLSGAISVDACAALALIGDGRDCGG